MSRQTIISFLTFLGTFLVGCALVSLLNNYFLSNGEMKEIAISVKEVSVRPISDWQADPLTIEVVYRGMDEDLFCITETLSLTNVGADPVNLVLDERTGRVPIHVRSAFGTNKVVLADFVTDQLGPGESIELNFRMPDDADNIAIGYSLENRSRQHFVHIGIPPPGITLPKGLISTVRTTPRA